MKARSMFHWFVLFVTFWLSGLTMWGQSCSNANLTGLYGYGGSGTDASKRPIAFEGTYNADGNGNLSGTQTQSVNGAISLNTAVTGIYTINADCNGTMTITPQGGTAMDYNLTVASGGGRAFGLAIDSGTTVTIYSRAVQEVSCTPGGTSGTFGFTGTGSVVGSGNLAESGQLTFDGAGHLTGIHSISLNGKIFGDVAVTGTYTVNNNCSGTAVIQSTGMPTRHLSFTLVRQLASMLFIETDPTTVFIGLDRE